MQGHTNVRIERATSENSDWRIWPFYKPSNDAQVVIIWYRGSYDALPVLCNMKRQATYITRLNIAHDRTFSVKFQLSPQKTLPWFIDGQALVNFFCNWTVSFETSWEHYYFHEFGLRWIKHVLQGTVNRLTPNLEKDMVGTNWFSDKLIKTTDNEKASTIIWDLVAIVHKQSQPKNFKRKYNVYPLWYLIEWLQFFQTIITSFSDSIQMVGTSPLVILAPLPRILQVMKILQKHWKGRYYRNANLHLKKKILHNLTVFKCHQ